MGQELYNFKFLVWNGFQRALNFLGAVLNYSKRFQASKVFHRFNATGLFRIVNGHSIKLPEECGHPLTIRNRPVALNR